MTTNRTDPPIAGDEVATLLGFLDFHRDTLRLKAEGLDAEQLARTTAASSLTLGGLLKHMALVEHSWFAQRLRGEPDIEPWASIDWDADPEWEFRTAADDDPEALRAMLDDAIANSRRCIDDALRDGGLDTMSAAPNRRGDLFSMRWIVVHMIEEYARHNGHADLIRESIDGQTGA